MKRRILFLFTEFRRCTVSLRDERAFPTALRAAIEASGLTLERLRHRLAQRGIQVSVTSLSYWQQGRSRPERADSLRAVRAIESILGVPPHSLGALLGPPRPRGRWLDREEREYDGILEPATALAETIKPMLGPSDRKLRVFSQDDAVTVGADRAIRSVRSRIVVRAVADDPDRYLAVYCGERGSTATDIEITERENCRLGRVRRHPKLPVIALELLFDHRLRAGETHLLEYVLAIDSPVESPDYRRGFRYPADAFVVSVRFAESALPARVFGFSQREPHVVPQVDGEMIITAGRWAHRAARDIRPGVLGIGWEWG
jgi:hypothetical protein